MDRVAHHQRARPAETPRALKLVPAPRSSGEEDHRVGANAWDGAPETFVLLASWVLAVGYVAVLVIRAQHFGPDACLAIAWALLGPFLCAGQAIELLRSRRDSENG